MMNRLLTLFRLSPKSQPLAQLSPKSQPLAQLSTKSGSHSHDLQLRLEGHIKMCKKTRDPLAVEVIHSKAICMGLQHHEPTVMKIMDLYVKVAQTPFQSYRMFNQLLMTSPPEGQVITVMRWCLGQTDIFDEDNRLQRIQALRILPMVHSKIITLALGESDLHVGMLMGLYSRLCMDHDMAIKLFYRLRYPGPSAWRNLIYSYADFEPQKAPEAFAAMEMRGIRPALPTFRAVLAAHARNCSDPSEPLELLRKMKDVYKVEPDVTHFGCVVNLLTKSGSMKKTVEFAARLPCLSDEICGMIFGTLTTEGLRLDMDMESVYSMIDVVRKDGGNYKLDYTVYGRLKAAEVEIPPNLTSKPRRVANVEGKVRPRGAFSLLV